MWGECGPLGGGGGGGARGGGGGGGVCYKYEHNEMLVQRVLVLRKKMGWMKLLLAYIFITRIRNKVE